MCSKFIFIFISFIAMSLPLSFAQAPVKIEQRLAKYAPFKLTSDLSHLAEKEKKMLPLLIEAAALMEEVFWLEAYGDKNKLFAMIKDPNVKRFAEMNCGPWDRLDDNAPFVAGIGQKPLGAQYYPADMTKAEFEASDCADKKSPYTILKRNAAGKLEAVPFHKTFTLQHEKAASLLKQAAELADDPDLKNYLNLRAQALLTDDYQASDFAWMDMKNNTLDIVIGPIENYEDRLLGIKTAHEAYVLIKDKAWSERLAKYAKFLPELQKNMPVPDAYKQEQPGADSDLNAYDVVYYAGDCNAGSKTIAINLPNDEEVQLKKGTRRLQLKNAMRAKYDKILLPISNQLIDPSQRKHVTFDAFFATTMFHEVAHGLGIKNTINNKGTCKDALQEAYSAIEEGKADILGLYMIQYLYDKGELKEGNLMDYYVTFVASIFRSVRFGAASAHGKANMLRFNYFLEKGAIVRNEKTGTYFIDLAKTQAAMKSLTEKILKLQGDGDYTGSAQWLKTQGVIPPILQKDLDRLTSLNLPVDVVFEQGIQTLGLKK